MNRDKTKVNLMNLDANIEIMSVPPISCQSCRDCIYPVYNIDYVNYDQQTETVLIV